MAFYSHLKIMLLARIQSVILIFTGGAIPVYVIYECIPVLSNIFPGFNILLFAS